MFYKTIRSIARVDPSRPAVVCGDAVTTYAELLAGIRSTLNVERKKPSRIVVVRTNDPVVFIRRVVVALALGRSVLPIPPGMPDTVYSRILDELPTGMDNSATLLHFTSGSYGAKKTVVRPIGNLVDEAESVALHLGLRRGQRLLVTTPLSHSFGCGLWRASVYAGATLYTSSLGHMMARLVQTKDAMKRGVDFVFGVPYLFRVLSRSGSAISLNPRTRCFAGGEPLLEVTAAQWYRCTGVKLQQEYGLSEGGITTLAHPDTPSMSIGSPIPNVTLRVACPDDKGVGELIVYRPCPPTRYLFDEAPETFMEDGGVRTGDLGYGDSHGFYLTGRIKSIIIVAGMKMVPSEVEDAIRKSSDVDEVVVIGVKDRVTGERPVAFVTPKHETVDVAGLRVMLRSELDSYKVPKRIEVIKELPRTSSGKVDRNGLQSYL